MWHSGTERHVWTAKPSFQNRIHRFFSLEEVGSRLKDHTPPSSPFFRWTAERMSGAAAAAWNKVSGPWDLYRLWPPSQRPTFLAQFLRQGARQLARRARGVFIFCKPTWRMLNIQNFRIGVDFSDTTKVSCESWRTCDQLLHSRRSCRS